MTQIFNTRILVALATIVFVGAIAASATGAFFSDTETSTGNTFAAGDIDLQIDNESYVTSTSTGLLVASPANSWAISNLTNQLFFSFIDVKPGDVGEDTISVHVGSNNAWACMAANITGKPENTVVDPETDAGDTAANGPQDGELQNFLNFTFWKDDGDNVYETGESQITQLTGSAGTIFNGAWLPLADTTTGTSSVLVGNSTNYIGKAWCFGTLTLAPVAQDGIGKTASSTNGPLVRGTGVSCNGSGSNNIAQTDGIAIDVSFQAVQSRNNPQFLCSSLPPLGGATSTPATTGGFTVTKVVTGTTTVPASAFSIQLKTAGGANVGAAQPGSGAGTNYFGLAPGSYFVQEASTTIPGFSPASFSLTCTGSSTPNTSNTFTVVAGATSTCSITNTVPQS